MKEHKMKNNETKKSNEKTVTVYKMRKRWKGLLVVSLILNMVFVGGVIGFSKFGSGKIRGVLSGNMYPMYVMNHQGMRTWYKHERQNGYKIKQDIKAQRQITVDLRLMLAQGKIDTIEFREGLNKVHKLHHANFKRFAKDFPAYWNNLSDEKRKKYVKKIKKEERYYD